GFRRRRRWHGRSWRVHVDVGQRRLGDGVVGRGCHRAYPGGSKGTRRRGQAPAADTDSTLEHLHVRSGPPSEKSARACATAPTARNVGATTHDHGSTCAIGRRATTPTIAPARAIRAVFHGSRTIGA